jgi:molybdate transport system ATP-binding protein
MDLNISLDVLQGDFIAITGESGSGKTTFLRILAGLEEAQGSLKINNEIWLDKNKKLSIQKRKIGFVFQDYALFPNMTVEQNLLFVSQDKVLANKLLKITNLTNLKHRMPDSLSGGQKQRVSLCRAMMNKPSLLLLDEPLSALDVNMRTKLQDEILTLHKEFNTTTFLVSHDPSEIYKLSNRVIVLQQGKIINDGKAKDILLKQNGSSKFSFEGKLLEIKKVDVIYIAIVSIGQQLTEIVVSYEEIKDINIGDTINISTKAFAPTIQKLGIGF